MVKLIPELQDNDSGRKNRKISEMIILSHSLSAFCFSFICCTFVIEVPWMKIIFHAHAIQRALERGASEHEILQTITEGEQFPAKYDRFGYRMNFHFESSWNGQFYFTKQIEVFAVIENENLIIITLIVKYF